MINIGWVAQCCLLGREVAERKEEKNYKQSLGNGERNLKQFKVN